MIYGPRRKGSRKESSQSLPLTSVLSHGDKRKTSSKSEGAAIDSRKVSFIDELTGMSARPDPKFEQQLQKHLKIVKEAGELGEFVQNSPRSSSSAFIQITRPNSNAASGSSATKFTNSVNKQDPVPGSSQEESKKDQIPDTAEEKGTKI